MPIKQSAFFHLQASFYNSCRDFYEANPSHEQCRCYKLCAAVDDISADLTRLEKMLKAEETIKPFFSEGPHHITTSLRVQRVRLRDPTPENIARVFYLLGRMSNVYYHIEAHTPDFPELNKQKRYLDFLYEEMVGELSHPIRMLPQTTTS